MTKLGESTWVTILMEGERSDEWTRNGSKVSSALGHWVVVFTAVTVLSALDKNFGCTIVHRDGLKLMASMEASK